MNLKKLSVGILIGFMLIFSACSNSEVENVQNDSKPDNQNSAETPEVSIQRQDGDKPEDLIEEAKLENLIADGIYTEKTTYQAPPKEEEIEITIEFENDVVKNLSIVGNDPHPTSKQYMGQSEEGLKDLLLGKKISDVEIPDSISGSSLTTKAFKEKLNEMKDKY